MKTTKKKSIAIALTLLALTGCMSVSEVAQVPPDQQAAVANFQMPVKPMDNAETIVYVVNRFVTVPHAWDRGLVMTTAISIEGATTPLETTPGHYAVAKIKPGKYPVRAQRLCRQTDQSVKAKESIPPEGTVMPVRQTGWSTYSGSYGRGLTSSDAVFDFQGGKTYVFSIFPSCAFVAQAGEVFLYPRIRETDEQSGKFLVMKSSPAQKQ